MNRQHSLLRASILSLSLLVTAGVSAEASSPEKGEKPKAAATGKAKSDKPTLQGRYKYAGPKSEKEVIKKQVDEIVWNAPENIRMMAKESLDRKTAIPDWYEIKQSGSKVVIHGEGRKVEVCNTEKPTDGLDPESNPSQLTIKREGSDLTQTITTAEGTRIVKFKAQPNNTMKVDVEIQSPRLQTPIKYSLTYKK